MQKVQARLVGSPAAPTGPHRSFNALVQPVRERHQRWRPESPGDLEARRPCVPGQIPLENALLQHVGHVADVPGTGRHRLFLAATAAAPPQPGGQRDVLAERVALHHVLSPVLLRKHGQRVDQGQAGLPPDERLRHASCTLAQIGIHVHVGPQENAANGRVRQQQAQDRRVHGEQRFLEETEQSSEKHRGGGPPQPHPPCRLLQ
mmetsp:Transcript_28919/g.80866  ORF Transcript_28919/g.80866 Transcript_28919/m.80866 type:complete len:204 (-) Transcript_28919:134-745(-)